MNYDLHYGIEINNEIRNLFLRVPAAVGETIDVNGEEYRIDKILHYVRDSLIGNSNLESRDVPVVFASRIHNNVHEANMSWIFDIDDASIIGECLRCISLKKTFRGVDPNESFVEIDVDSSSLELQQKLDDALKALFDSESDADDISVRAWYDSKRKTLVVWFYNGDTGILFRQWDGDRYLTVVNQDAKKQIWEFK